MDRRHYDPRTLSIFDTIGAYFINTFYNDIYKRAQSMVQEGTAKTVTDAYRACIYNFMNGIKDRRDIYNSVVTKLHEYYRKISGFSSITLGDFIDKVVSKFVPEQYFRDLTSDNKDNILHDTIVYAVNQLGAFMLGRESIKMVIDDHTNEYNITLLQDKSMDIFATKREDYFARFAKTIVKSNTNGNLVSEEVLEQLKMMYVAEKKQRYTLESWRTRASNMIKQLLDTTTRLKDENKKLMTENNNMKMQLEQLQNERSVALTQSTNKRPNTNTQSTANSINNSQLAISARDTQIKNNNMIFNSQSSSTPITNIYSESNESNESNDSLSQYESIQDKFADQLNTDPWQ